MFVVVSDRGAELFVIRLLLPGELGFRLLSVDCDISGQCTIDGMTRLVAHRSKATLLLDPPTFDCIVFPIASLLQRIHKMT